MRTLRTLAVAMAATAVLPLAGMAQDTTPKDPASPTMQPPAASSTMENTTTMDSPATTDSTMSEAAVITTQKDGQVLSDSYIGASVVARSTEGVESVGKVSELLLDENDKIVGVVVDVGGFLGVGAKPVGLAWTGLSEEMSDGAVLLKTSLTREELEAAPEFKTLEAQQVEADREMIKKEQVPTTAPTTTQ
jgi:hypothetical protein